MRDVDFIVRDCGLMGFIPIIKVVDGEELYRGSLHQDAADAWITARETWCLEKTQNVKDFKNPPTCLEGCD